MIPRLIGFPVPCSLGIQVPIHPGSHAAQVPSSDRYMAPGDLGTMPHQVPRLLDPWPPWDPGPSPNGSPGTKPGQSPRCHDPSTAHAPWYLGARVHRDIDDQAPRWTLVPMDPGIKRPRSPRYQGAGAASCRRQLGAFISSTTLVPCLDGSFVDSAPSSHRPPWSLARIGPSLPLSPRSPSHQVGAGDMVPSPPACQGVRCTSIASETWRQAIASPRMPRCLPYIGTSVPRPPWSPLHQGADGSEGPSRRWRIGRLDPPRDKRSRGLDGLGPSAIEAPAAPRSHAPSFTLVPPPA